MSNCRAVAADLKLNLECDLPECYVTDRPVGASYNLICAVRQ